MKSAPEATATPDWSLHGVDAGPMTPTVYHVVRRREETHDTFTLELAPATGARPFPFAPGQFNMLYIFGVGEAPISISGNPAHPGKLVHTTREVGPVTRAMGRLRSGESLGVRGPFGTAWPVEKAVGRDVVIVAGGIGLAPLRPALYSVLEHREEYGRVTLLYGTRTPEDILFIKELEKWRARLDASVHVTVDRAASSWRGSVGVVTTLISRCHFDPLNTVAMVCGPEIMMRFTVLELEKRGVNPGSIFVSMERNMKCAIGFCGHCQFGPAFICKDGPIFSFDRIRPFFELREV